MPSLKTACGCRQEPVFDSPINLGAHCAKGASVREHGHGDHRLKTPMKLVNGKYQRISWQQALDEVSAKLLGIRKASGPDAVFWIGSSKHNNEQSYLFRKFVSMFGSNNMDHQARICHATTVAGVANTWGYGAMTNSFNDMQNSKCALYIGSNAAEAHPVSMVHMLHAKEAGAKMIVVDPRRTRTAAKADEYVRIRSGTDIPFLFGLLYHIFNNGWEDKKYINDRVYGMDKIRENVMATWNPAAVEDACGVPEEQMFRVAEMMAKNRPSTLVWCMGQTQHSIGNAMVRASCIVQLALGNIGVSGGGANIFRGHDNVQGATDIGPNPDSLPGYYGVSEGAWKHWCEVWGTDYEWMKAQFAPGMMTKPGTTVSRWIDAVLEKEDLIDQPTNVKATVFWGHSPNSQSRGLEMKKAFDKLDLLVVIDPYPSATAALAAMPGASGDLNPNRDVYLLPAATQFECPGLGDGVEPFAAVAPESHRAALGVDARSHDHGRVRREVRIRPAVQQELQDAAAEEARRGLEGTGNGIGPPGNQHRGLDGGLHRAVARSPEGTHAQHACVRRQDAEGKGRQGRRDRL